MNTCLEEDIYNYIEKASFTKNKRNLHGKCHEMCIEEYLINNYGFISIPYGLYHNELPKNRYVIVQPRYPNVNRKADLLIVAKDANKTKEFPKTNLKIYTELRFQNVNGSIDQKIPEQLDSLFGLDSLMICSGNYHMRKKDFYSRQTWINERNHTKNPCYIMKTDMFEDWANRAFG